MWKTVYESVMGTSHSDTDTPCQDACRVVNLTMGDSNLLVVCSADGAGSADHADEGAEIACDTFIRLIKRDYQNSEFAEQVDHEIILGWFRELRSQVESRANELEVEMRQMASTFLGAIIGESTALFMQIGDGAMVTFNGDVYNTVFWPQSGEFANTTNFLTDDQFEKNFEWCRIDERMDELAVFSDGLERLILHFADRAVHEPFLAPMFKALRQTTNPEELFEPLRSFLDSEEVNERTNDDKTLILATRLNHCDNDKAIC